MVGGYLIVWAASFVFILSMVRRQRGLQREIDALKEAAGQNETATTVREVPGYEPTATVR
jgi:CcmD family protein